MMRSSDDPGETDAGILAPHTTQGRRGLGFRGLGSRGVWFRVLGVSSGLQWCRASWFSSKPQTVSPNQGFRVEGLGWALILA